MKRNVLNKTLYNAARAHVAPGFTNDDEAIRLVRQSACEVVTEWMGGEAAKQGDYTKLNDEQINFTISFLNKGKGYLEQYVRKFELKTEYATKKQLGKLWFCAIECALQYCDFEKFSCRRVHDGAILTGEAARAEAKFLQSIKKLGGSWKSWLYNNWINPKSNEFLMEGDFRVVKEKNMWYLNYSELTREEADYLIKRYRAMQNVVSERYEEQPEDEDEE